MKAKMIMLNKEGKDLSCLAGGITNHTAAK